MLVISNMSLNNTELLKITGGAFNFSASMFNAISRTVDTIFQIGRSIGSSIRMIMSKRIC